MTTVRWEPTTDAWRTSRLQAFLGADEVVAGEAKHWSQPDPAGDDRRQHRAKGNGKYARAMVLVRRLFTPVIAEGLEI